MQINSEASNSKMYTYDNIHYGKLNYGKTVCASEMFSEKSPTLVGENNKLFTLLTTIMKENTHRLETFKSKYLPVNCRAENAIKIFFGWSVGANIKELSDYLAVNEDVTRHFYLLSTLYAKKYIKSHLEDWRIGGPGVVVLLDVYPGGCRKFNYSTNPCRNSILCIAEIKEIPTNFWFQILSQVEEQLHNREILESVQTIVRAGSILVIDLQSTIISQATYQKLKQLYQIAVSLEDLQQHDSEHQCLLNNLETIWKPALDICEFGNYHGDISSYYTSFLWNQRFGNDNLSMLMSQF